MKKNLLPIGLLIAAGLLHFQQNTRSVLFSQQKLNESTSTKTQYFQKDNSKTIVHNDGNPTKKGKPANLEITPSEEPIPQAAWSEVQRCFDGEDLISSDPAGDPALSLTQLVSAAKKLNVRKSPPFLHWENFHLETDEGKEIRVRNLPTENTIQLFTLDSEGLPEKVPLPVDWEILPRESQLEEALKLGRIKTHQRALSLSSTENEKKHEIEWEEENNQVLQASIRTNKGILGCTQFHCVCK